MRSIWFKQCYVAPILNGEKTDTIRDGDKTGRFRKGDIVAASVGPRPRFAVLEITDVELVDIDSIPVERGLALLELYPNTNGLLTSIGFSVLSPA